MDSSSIGLLIVFIILIFCSAYCSCSESAFSVANKIRIKKKAEEGNKRAKKAHYILTHFDEALTTLLICNNIVNLSAASVATLFTYRACAESLRNGQITKGVLEILCTVIATAIVFMFGEMTPKSLANDRGDTMAMLCAGPLRLLMKILKPFVFLFSYIIKLITKLFHAKEEPSITEEELVSIIETAEEEGVMDEEQSDLLKSALEFSETKVSDVMTVRSDIFAIDLNKPNHEILKLLKEQNYSRVPAYVGRLDNLVGILNTRKFMIEYAKNPKFDVKPLVARPYPVRGNAKINDLLTFMRQRKVYMAVVTDDKKHIVGIVTIEDFLEELVGEIWDEDDEYDDAFVKTGGNHFIVSVKLTIGDAMNRIGISGISESLSRKPLLAWIFEVFGRMPKCDESFQFGHLTVTIDSVVDSHPEKLNIYVETNGADTMPPLTGTEVPTLIEKDAISDKTEKDSESEEHTEEAE